MNGPEHTEQVLDARHLLMLSGGVVAPPPAVRLAESLPIDAEERLGWERRLNRYLNSCGCAEATAGLFLGTVAALAAHFSWSRPWPAWGTAMAIALPFALLASGKAAGRWFDRLRFRKVCGRLLARLGEGAFEANRHG